VGRARGASGRHELVAAAADGGRYGECAALDDLGATAVNRCRVSGAIYVNEIYAEHTQGHRSAAADDGPGRHAIFLQIPTAQDRCIVDRAPINVDRPAAGDCHGGSGAAGINIPIQGRVGDNGQRLAWEYGVCCYRHRTVLRLTGMAPTRLRDHVVCENLGRPPPQATVDAGTGIGHNKLVEFRRRPSRNRSAASRQQGNERGCKAAARPSSLPDHAVGPGINPAL
jgi:hypothetical protein